VTQNSRRREREEEGEKTKKLLPMSNQQLL